MGILGATVMPHSLFLGSALATQDRALVKTVSLPSVTSIPATRSRGLVEKFSDLFRPVHTDSSEDFESHADRPNNSLSFIKAHLHHAMVDIIVNLLGLAVIINSLYVSIMPLSLYISFKWHTLQNIDSCGCCLSSTRGSGYGCRYL